ncbi:hypothetical protein KI387_030484, partial [Taxus chinensis]
SYDYTIDTHKLNLFTATVKDETLRWFMGLGRDVVTTWAKMKEKFLTEHQDYC